MFLVFVVAAATTVLNSGGGVLLISLTDLLIYVLVSSKVQVACTFV